MAWRRKLAALPCEPSPAPVPGLAIGVCLALSLFVLVGVGTCVRRIMRPSAKSTLEEPVAADDAVRYRRPPLRFVFPTDQTNLADTASVEVYMPTASGRVVSALYGSTRTAGESGNFSPRFHEGIDIAPLRRAPNGRALDEVYAVADGRVAYIQNAPGGSTYGRYVALTHEDPVGTVYSLYAHLDAVAPDLRQGALIAAGDALGRMGNSASFNIPTQRSHLHLEIGTIMNSRFEAWYRSRRLTPSHGLFNGLNLFGLDPLRVLLERDAEEKRAVLDVLLDEPPAFTLALKPNKLPDYYERYPDLWEAAAPPGVVWIDVSEGGVPLRARSPAPDAPVPAVLPGVVSVDTEALGRNGRGLVRRRSDAWELSASGNRWIEHLLFQ